MKGRMVGEKKTTNKNLCASVGRVASLSVRNLFFLLFSLFSLLSCKDLFNIDLNRQDHLPPLQQEQNYGYFALYDSSARSLTTVMPPSVIAANIPATSKLELEFTNTEDTSQVITEELTWADRAEPVTLPVGIYDLEVTLYNNDTTPKPILRGTLKNISISAGATTTPTDPVELLPITDGAGVGYFAWNISLPYEVTGNLPSEATMVILKGTSPEVTIDLVTDPASNSLHDIDSGIYDLKVTLINAQGVVYVKLLSLHIYEGLTSTYTDTFTNSVFYNSPDNPFMVNNAEELTKVGKGAANNDPYYNRWTNYAYYELAFDIDLSITNDSWIGGSNWTPIPTFYGEFNGDGNTISGLSINDSTADYQGLFGSIGQGGIVKNLNVEGIITGRNWTGGIAGTNSGSIINCSFSGKIQGGRYTGGIVGRNNGMITNCYNLGRIEGLSLEIGGIAGTSANLNSVISMCYNSGEVSATSEAAGGIVGSLPAGIISNCYNVARISGNTMNVGGIVGTMNASSNTPPKIENCYNIGDIIGTTNQVGGIAGRNGSGEINNCVSLGLSVTGPADVGRIAGVINTSSNAPGALPGVNTNNRARTDMLVNNSTVTDSADSAHGLDTPLGTELSTVFSGWGSAWDIPGGSLTENGDLPRLAVFNTSNPAANPYPMLPAHPAANTVFVSFNNGTEIGYATLALALAQTTAEGNYNLRINADQTLAPTTLSVTSGTKNITLIAGAGVTEAKIQLDGQEQLFTISTNVTLTLEKGVTLVGVDPNEYELVRVLGTFNMENDSKITGNKQIAMDGGGVFVASGGTFNMNGGIISGNQDVSEGGGVHNEGTFNMYGGTISDNENGGVANYGTFRVGGNAVIKNNKINNGVNLQNVKLNNNYIIIGSGENAPNGMEIWVNTTRTDGVIVQSSIAGQEQYFKADNGQNVARLETGEIVITGLAFEQITSGANAGTYCVRAGTVTSGAVIIPSHFNGAAVTEIGSLDDYEDEGSFMGLNITSVHIPSTITVIGTSAFRGCEDLETINIPNSVTTIGDYAFMYMGLENIIIPESVTSIGLQAFAQSLKLLEINVNVNNPNYASENGLLYNKTKNLLIQVPAGLTVLPAIPSSVVTIGIAAFQDCKFSSVVLPVSVTTLNDGVFSNCSSLLTINMPGVTTIDEGAFHTANLTSITISANCNINAVQTGRFNLFRDYYTSPAGGNNRAGTYTWNGTAWTGPAGSGGIIINLPSFPNGDPVVDAQDITLSLNNVSPNSSAKTLTITIPTGFTATSIKWYYNEVDPITLQPFELTSAHGVSNGGLTLTLDVDLPGVPYDYISNGHMVWVEVITTAGNFITRVPFKVVY